MTLPLQAVPEPLSDQNFLEIARRWDERPNLLDLTEREAPEAPPADGVRIYAADNGGKTQLLALFNTGEPQVIAEQP